MTERHNRVIKALGNGGYVNTMLMRVGGAAMFIAILGAVYWAGSKASSVEQKISGNTSALNRFIEVQKERDQGQDQRLNAILQQLWNERRSR